MYMNMYIIIFIICVFVVYLMINKNIEKMKDDKDNKKSEDAYKYKNIYDDVKIYENEVGRQGLDICLEKCRGNCVEHGIFGKSYCFE